MEEKTLSNREEDALGEFIKVVVISLAIILPVRYFLVQPFYVKGASMEPSFFDHEYLIIDELSYRFREPKRGEVVVFRPPQEKSEFFIKRVVGLPGEKVEIRSGDVVVYNNENPKGMRLDENYLFYDTDLSEKAQIQLGMDEFFMMGDNRPHSLDSRRIGPIKKGMIVGRAWFRAWPLNRISVFKSQQY